ncbi:MAG: response regulator transcription factor [Vulcanimicrobiaceae bacterium]
MRILIVEDDVRISEPVADDLRRQGHVVDVAADGPAGLAFARSGVYELVLLDIMLPQIDGVEVARRLRAERSPSLILMLTARDSLGDKVTSLDAGADDYVVKPVALEELSARIRALGRRGFEARGTVLEHGKLRIESDARRAFVGDTPLPLTPAEYALLENFLRYPRQTFSKLSLLDRISGFERVAGEESIKTHVTNLRRKIREAGGTADAIATVYGYGYRLGAAA